MWHHADEQCFVNRVPSVWCGGGAFPQLNISGCVVFSCLSCEMRSHDIYSSQLHTLSSSWQNIQTQIVCWWQVEKHHVHVWQHAVCMWPCVCQGSDWTAVMWFWWTLVSKWWCNSKTCVRAALSVTEHMLSAWEDTNFPPASVYSRLVVCDSSPVWMTHPTSIHIFFFPVFAPFSRPPGGKHRHTVPDQQNRAWQNSQAMDEEIRHIDCPLRTSPPLSLHPTLHCTSLYLSLSPIVCQSTLTKCNGIPVLLSPCSSSSSSTPTFYLPFLCIKNQTR